MIKDIAFTVYAVTDIKRSREFYEGILGLVPGKDFPPKEDSAWIEYEVGSGVFAIGCSPEWKPSEDGASVAFEVEDFDVMIAKLKEHNLVFKVEPQEFPTCHMAVVKDPDGNHICIHKRK